MKWSRENDEGREEMAAFNYDNLIVNKFFLFASAYD